MGDLIRTVESLPVDPVVVDWRSAVPAGRIGYDLSARSLLLHTFQSNAAYRVLRRDGVLRGPTNVAMIDYPGYAGPYGWMSRQLRRRVSEAGQDGHGPDAMPLWAWARTTRHELVRQARWTARHAPGEVLLTLRVPASRVLLSRYDEWHTVLNNSPLWPPDLSVDDLDSFDADWDAAWGADWHKRLAAGPEPALLDALESSWEAVFEVSVGSRRWAIQACLATIRAADVRDVVMIGASHRTGSTEPMLSSD